MSTISKKVARKKWNMKVEADMADFKKKLRASVTIAESLKESVDIGSAQPVIDAIKKVMEEEGIRFKPQPEYGTDLSRHIFPLPVPHPKHIIITELA